MYGTVKEVFNAEELKEARQGRLAGFPEHLLPRRAVTVAVFPELEAEELRNFRRAAGYLAGRYHFVYMVDPRWVLRRVRVVLSVCGCSVRRVRRWPRSGRWSAPGGSTMSARSTSSLCWPTSRRSRCPHW